MLRKLIGRLVSFATRPLVIAQAFSSVAGGLSTVLGAVILGPSQFTTFALLSLLGNIAVGIGRSSVFQPALIQQRHDDNAFVHPRVTTVLCVLTAASTGLLARPLGVSSWSEAALIAGGALFPIAYDWLRFRAMGMNQRWPVAIGDSVRMVMVPLALILPLPATAVALQVYFTAACAVPFLLLLVIGRRPGAYTPYSSYVGAAAWQLGDFAVGQFIVQVPLLVLGSSTGGSTVSGIRLAQALLGPLTLVFAASVGNLMADAATQESYRSQSALIRQGTVLARTIAANALMVVLLTAGVVAVLGIDTRGVDNESLVFGLLLVGGYMVLTGWSGIHAMIMRLLNRQASVTLGRVVITAITLGGFAGGYLFGGPDESVVTGFITAGIISAAVMGTLARSAYRTSNSAPAQGPLVSGQ
ncbi:MAG: hypothetical protein JWR90_2909 [Marmoricola sp.]|nr:hypothetical protein [Marmoricola sp.]